MPLAAETHPVVARMRDYRQCLFNRWVDAKRHAAGSDVLADHQAAVDAYTRFMRAHLASDERTHLDLEDEIARLTAENGRLRQRVRGGGPA